MSPDNSIYMYAQDPSITGQVRKLKSTTTVKELETFRHVKIKKVSQGKPSGVTRDREPIKQTRL